MAHGHTLGLAGGARGVDHVGQVVRLHVKLRRAELAAGQPGSARLQHQALDSTAGGQLHRRLGQQQADATVLDHVGQALLRIIRVQRHIGATGLEDTQQAHHHFQAALQRQPHQYIRPYPALAQSVCQLVGALVELPVAQRLPGKQHGGGVRGALRLGGDQLMHTALAVKPRLGAVPGLHLLLLLSIQQRQVGDALLRLRDNVLQQLAPMAGQTLDGRCVEQRGGVVQRGADALFGFDRFQGQIELGAVLLPLQAFDRQARQAVTRVPALGLVVVHHLEQRAVAEAALRVQRLHQLLERQVLMRLRRQCGALYLVQQRLEGGVQIELGLEHLGVDEEADQALGLHPVAVGNRHTDANLGLTRVAVQQRLETGQQQHEQGHTLLPGQAFEGTGQAGLQFDCQARARLALDGRTRPVEGQFEHRRVATQLLGPVSQLARLLPRLHPVALPDCVVGILDRQCRQLYRLAQAIAFVEPDQFLDHHRHRPAIGDDMVQGQYQHMVIVTQLQQLDPQQRAAFQVERAPGLGFHPLPDQRLAVCTRRHLNRIDVQCERCRSMNHLQGLTVSMAEGGTQGLVACHQGLETAAQRLHIQRTLQAQRRRHVVGGALWLQLPQKPLALLRIGQAQFIEQRLDRRNRQVGGTDALGLHAFPVNLALVRRQHDETLGDALGGIGVH